MQATGWGRSRPRTLEKHQGAPENHAALLARPASAREGRRELDKGAVFSLNLRVFKLKPIPGLKDLATHTPTENLMSNLNFLKISDPKLVQLGGDVPWVWGVDGGRGDLAVNERNVKNVAFVTSKEHNRSRGPEVQRSRGPEVQRSRGPEVQRSRGPRFMCQWS